MIRSVAVAVVSWNGLEHLETCLPALESQDDPGVPWEILLLDNGSKDGTADWVRRHHPRVRLIESPVNLGFCAGNNRLVAASEADAVAFLNNDTRPEPGWLKALATALADSPPDVAAVSGKIVDWNAQRLDFARGVMTFDGHAFQLGFRRRLATLESGLIPAAGEELLFACGGNMLVRTGSFVAAGGFDEDYFAYLEDVDLGWRLWAGGERVTFAPEAVIRHRSSATSDLLGLYNRGFLFERNAFLTAYKNYQPETWAKLMPAVLLTFLSRTRSLLEANPGGETLAVDPYAGLIADTGESPGSAQRSTAAPRLGDPLSAEVIRAKWRSYGPAEFLRRGWGRLSRLLAHRQGRATAAEPGEAPRLTDQRTVAQLRALSYLLGHLDAAAAKRCAAARRRRRPDAEILERFPLYVVPTYPGDEELFGSEGFKSWLPNDLPLVRKRLDEVMEWG